MKRAFLLAFITTALVAAAAAQTNLLLDTNARSGASNWRSHGDATIEDFEGEASFTVRNGGYFLQDIPVDRSAAGKFALFIGRGSSERINADGAITGLPYLYGYMMESNDPRGGKIIDYLQGQMMRAAARVPDEWVMMHGIFPIPEGTVAIRFFLEQAERSGVPHNGSAARFNDLGLYLFDTREDAAQFVKSVTK
jgi:hypothetical protein